MIVPLDELNLAELRWLCRQCGVAESYDRENMRRRIRRARKQ